VHFISFSGKSVWGRAGSAGKVCIEFFKGARSPINGSRLADFLRSKNKKIIQISTISLVPNRTGVLGTRQR